MGYLWYVHGISMGYIYIYNTYIYIVYIYIYTIYIYIVYIYISIYIYVLYIVIYVLYNIIYICIIYIHTHTIYCLGYGINFRTCRFQYVWIRIWVQEKLDICSFKWLPGDTK